MSKRLKTWFRNERDLFPRDAFRNGIGKIRPAKTSLVLKTCAVAVMCVFQ